MTQVTALLDRLKHAHALQSDYALAKLLNVNQQTVAFWRSGRSAPEAAIVVKIAELLDQEPLPVVALIELEREQHKKQPRPWIIELWRRYSPRLLPAFAFALVIAGGIQERSEGPSVTGRSIPYAYRIRRWLQSRFGMARKAAKSLSAAARRSRACQVWVALQLRVSDGGGAATPPPAAESLPFEGAAKAGTYGSYVG